MELKDYTIEQKAKAYDELIAKLIKAKEDDMLNDNEGLHRHYEE